MTTLNKKMLARVLWCDRKACEEQIKERSKEESIAALKEGADQNEELLTGAAKTLCIPFDQKPIPSGAKCFCGCGQDAKVWAVFGRTY